MLALSLLGCEGEGSAKRPPPNAGFDASLPPLEAPDAGPPLDCRTSRDDQDADGDGVTPNGGDCDDCEELVNPRAIEIPKNEIDEDCVGGDAKQAEPACDDEIDDESLDPEDAARVLGQCRFVTPRSRNFGVIDARFSGMSEDSELEHPLQVWLTESFGDLAPREGGRFVVLSTGVARDVSARDYTESCDLFGSQPDGAGGFSGGEMPPSGYPKDSSLCEDSPASANAPAYNTVSFSITLRAPSNARSLSFDSMFFTYEYPDFVCSRYNDFFVVFADPAPRELDDANVLFDEHGDPIGVNTGLLRACRQSSRSSRRIACDLGAELLRGTGFGEGESTCLSEVSDETDIGGASTGWLETTVPVEPGELFTLRFLLWDSGDPLVDSTVVLDAIRWSLESPAVGTRPITSG